MSFLAFAFYCDRVQQQVIGFYAFLTQQKQPSVYFPCVGQIHRWMATKNIMTFPHENWRKYVESRKKFFFVWIDILIRNNSNTDINIISLLYICVRSVVFVKYANLEKI